MDRAPESALKSAKKTFTSPILLQKKMLYGTIILLNIVTNIKYIILHKDRSCFLNIQNMDSKGAKDFNNLQKKYIK